MKIHIVTTHENARQDEEYKQWISDLFQAAVRQFNRDSGTETEVQIQYREKTRRVRVFNSSQDFTYSVIQLTGSIDPIPGTIPRTEEEWIVYDDTPGRSDVPDSKKAYRKFTKTVEPKGPTGPREEGYRILGLGETVEAGDEFYVRGTNQWKTTSCAGHVVLPWSLAYRRKIAA